MADELTSLAKFTPKSVDRDALLYAAGRAAAPSRRPWQAATATLAVLQAITVAAWMAQPSAPPGEPVVPSPPAPAYRDDPSPWQPPDPSSYIALRDHLDDPRPTLPGDADAPPGKPLTVRSNLD